MLFVPRLSVTPWKYDDWGANPASTAGTSVTPGASNVEGSWTQVASAANIAQEVCGFSLHVHSGATATAQKDHLLDLGVDPAGGTSYTAMISNLVCGASATSTAAASGHRFYFPLRIPAGSAVAVRIQGSNATAGTVRVATRFYGQCSSPATTPIGSFSETIGTITNSQGVSFTPGNAADGSWTSLGTTTNPLFWWQIGYQVSNGTITAEYTYIELAYGDASNKHVIGKLMHGGTTSETVGAILSPTLTLADAYYPVPAGSTLYIRGRCNNAPDTGYNAVAVGVG